MITFFERLNRAFWAGCLGIIVLFVFFAAIGGFSPADVIWLSALVFAMAIAFAFHAYRVRRQMAGPGGLSREQQRMRERRGF